MLSLKLPYSSRDCDIMQTAPLILMAVHHHQSILLLCPPLSLQVQLYLLSQ